MRSVCLVQVQLCLRYREILRSVRILRSRKPSRVEKHSQLPPHVWNAPMVRRNKVDHDVTLSESNSIIGIGVVARNEARELLNGVGKKICCPSC